MLLEMSNGDPLRAQEIEEKLSGDWFDRWVIWRNEKAEAETK